MTSFVWYVVYNTWWRYKKDNYARSIKQYIRKQGNLLAIAIDFTPFVWWKSCLFTSVLLKWHGI